MDKDEIIMMSIMIAGAILAIPIMFAIWPPMKRKLEKSRFGKILLGAGANNHRGGKLVFFVATLVWGINTLVIFLIWAILIS